MPNLRSIVSLHEAVGHELRPHLKDVKRYLLNSSASNDHERIEKGFNLHEGFNTESQPSILQYFQEKKKETVALVFFDIDNFSEYSSKLNTDEISEYLDTYYKRIMPIIYGHGGEIEKTIGDGIICVFGKPFLNVTAPWLLRQAEACSADAVKKLAAHNISIKAALHSGNIMYYSPMGDFVEYTMIGQPLTELFRLEGVARARSINFYSSSGYAALLRVTSKFSLSELNEFEWIKEAFIEELKGLGRREITSYKLQ